MFSEKIPEEKEDLRIEFVREWMSRDPDAGGHSVHCRKSRKLPPSEARREEQCALLIWCVRSGTEL